MSLISILGVAAVPTIICLLLGIVCLIVEMFTPGFGVAGGVGFLSLIAAIVMQIGWGSPQMALLIIAIVLCIIVLALVIFIRSFQRGRLSRSFLVLKESIDGASSSLGDDSAKALIGKFGTAVTSLRPSGIVEIDGKRLDVMTAGAFVDKGNSVRVTAVDGVEILVVADDTPAADSDQ